MIHIPELNRGLPSAETRFCVSYNDGYYTPDDERLDESHIHGCYEVYFNLSGDVSFLVNNRLYAIKSGDAVITRPGDVHLCILRRACVHEHFCLWVNGEESSPLVDFLEKSFGSVCYSFGEKKERLASLFRRLHEGSGSLFKDASLLFGLLSFLEEQGEEHVETDSSAMPAAMQKIVNDINENFTELHCIGDILSRYYISQATLNRWFRKYVHLSPKEFLEAKKLSYAKSLLSEGKSVTEVCARAGFNDCSHFISVFKKRFGETPLRYKAGLK